MSKLFADLLNSPLPSKANEAIETPITESTDIDNTPEIDEEDPGNAKVEDGDEGDYVGNDVTISDEDLANMSDDDEEDDDFDPDNLSDEELEELDADLSNTLFSDNDDEENVSLSPEEEMQADDMMGVAATTVLINKELNADEKQKFVESSIDTQIAVNEGLLTEAEVQELREEIGLALEGANKYNRKMIIRLDKESKMKQLYAVAINVSANAHNDPDYRKYKKVLRAKKILKAKLRKKYHNEALKRMKVYYKRLTTSKSPVLSKLGQKIQKQ